MTNTHPYWANYGYYPPAAPDANPNNPLNLPDRFFPVPGHPGYHPGNTHPATAPAPVHHTHIYPHPYQQFTHHPTAAPAPAHYTHHYPNPPHNQYIHHTLPAPHPAQEHHIHHHPVPTASHSSHPHPGPTHIPVPWAQPWANAPQEHHVHILQIRVIVLDEGTDNVGWTWHITDRDSTPVTGTVKIHDTLKECIEDASQHGNTSTNPKHKDFSESTWIWHITGRDGNPQKVSATVHKNLDDCIADVRKHSIAAH